MSPSKKSFKSFLPLLFVLLTVAVGFILWFRSRPAYLLFQLRKEISQGNASSVITRYKFLLERKDLSKPDEILLRRTLAEFYLDALGERSTLALRGGSTQGYSVTPSFLLAAKSEAKRVLELDPADGLGHWILGRIFLMEGLENYAREELGLSQKYLPKDPRPLYVLSCMSSDRGDPELGRDQALKSLAIDPQFVDAKKALIDAYIRLGEYTAALKAMDSLPSDYRMDASVLSQRVDIFIRQFRWDLAEENLIRLQQLFPNDVKTKMAEGKYRLALHSFDQAEALFLQANAMTPWSVWPISGVIESAAAQRKCQSIEPLTQLLSDQLPRWSGTYVALADLSLCRGEPERSITYLNEALSFSGDDERAIIRKANLCLDLERFDELGRLLRPLLDKKLHQVLAYRYLMESFGLQGNAGMANEMAENATKAAHAQGIVLEQSNQYLRRAEAAYLEGKRALEQDQPAEAIQVFLQALDDKPWMLRAQLGLVEARYKLRDIAGARQDLSVAVKLNSKNARVQHWRKMLD